MEAGTMTFIEFLLIIISVFSVTNIVIYIFLKNKENDRIRYLAEHLSKFEAGGVEKGGCVILWAPNGQNSIITLTCIFSVVIFFILLLLDGVIVYNILAALIAVLALIGTSLGYYFLYYLRRIGNIVQIADAKGIRESLVTKHGLSELLHIEWSDVKGYEVISSGGGDSLGEGKIGIELTSKNRKIAIATFYTNTSLLYFLMATEYLKGKISPSMEDYLLSIGRKNPQKLLNITHSFFA